MSTRLLPVALIAMLTMVSIPANAGQGTRSAGPERMHAMTSQAPNTALGGSGQSGATAAGAGASTNPGAVNPGSVPAGGGVERMQAPTTNPIK